jgi:hypothetical protein
MIFISIFNWIIIKLETHIKHINQVLYKFIKTLK